MRLTDTRTRRVEEVRPADGRQLLVYACGPTVYRDAHVGNLRTFLLHDLVRRVGEVVEGWDVRLVQNITDVGHLVDDDAVDPTGEDKLLAQARLEGRGALEIARIYERRFVVDCAALNIRPPDAAPRASEWVPQMIELVERLLERGHAYAAPDGSVYFDARSFDGYGAISGNRLEDLQAGHRHDAEELGEGKRFHADWALWKGTDDRRAELVWDTPWGRGFPGWHTECSAMSVGLLGEHVDLHTGGIDLRFPHHEDERAQSDAAVGHEVVRHWVHGEHLLFEGRKMSKSAGNVVLLRDVADRGHDPLALRLAFMQARYRTQVNLTWDAIAGADRRLTRWRRTVAAWAEQPSAAIHDGYRARFSDALRDDLDTTTALVVLGELEHDDDVADGSKFETFAWADRLLGLDLVRLVGAVPAALPEGAQQLLDERATARAAKDFAASDRLRDQLASMGVAVTDTKDGQHTEVTGG